MTHIAYQLAWTRRSELLREAADRRRAREASDPPRPTASRTRALRRLSRVAVPGWLTEVPRPWRAESARAGGGATKRPSTR